MPVRHQLHRRDAIGSAIHAMPFVDQKRLQQIAHIRIVLEHQDRAAVAGACDLPPLLAALLAVPAAAPPRAAA